MTLQHRARILIHLDAACVAGFDTDIPFCEFRILISSERSSGPKKRSICFPVDSGSLRNELAILLLNSELAAVSGLNACRAI